MSSLTYLSSLSSLSYLSYLSSKVAALSATAASLSARLALVESNNHSNHSNRTKEKAGENEAKDINAIIEGINTKNKCGINVLDAFASKFPGREILSARPRQGGNRGTHYDFEMLIRTGATEEWKCVEHKGSRQASPIKSDENPWDAGVQFHNGGCEKYSLAKKYALAWHDMYIASNTFKEEFGITAPVPTYDEWFKGDCKAQDDPKTAFGKELKHIVRTSRKSSLLEKRDAVNSALDITKDDVRTLADEVLPIANHALKQKDYWLTIRGDLLGDFVCAWYPQFTITAIEEVIVTKNKDIELEFRCEDDFVFHGILRWGKGAGFSNLRLDLK